ELPNLTAGAGRKRVFAGRSRERGNYADLDLFAPQFPSRFLAVSIIFSSCIYDIRASAIFEPFSASISQRISSNFRRPTVSRVAYSIINCFRVGFLKPRSVSLPAFRFLLPKTLDGIPALALLLTDLTSGEDSLWIGS